MGNCLTNDNPVQGINLGPNARGVRDITPLLLLDTSQYPGSTFLDVQDERKSFSNTGESLLAWEYVRLLTICKVNLQDIGIISAYKSQVQMPSKVWYLINTKCILIIDKSVRSQKP